jgi:hypothetical protein
MIKRLLTLTASLLIAFAIGECGLRMVWRRPPETLAIGQTGIHQHDPELGWRPKPLFTTPHTIDVDHTVTVRTNSKGWRDREHVTPAPPGTRRIVIVGDSYTFGWGVEDREHFPARLEALDPSLDVVALGASGWNLQQHLKVLVAEGFSYQPDLIVVALVNNDITDFGIPTGPDQVSRRFVGERPPDSKRSWFYMVDLFRSVAASSRAIGQAGIRLGLWDATDANYLPDDLKPALTKPPPEMQVRWTVALDYLGRIVAEAQQRQVPIVVATIPGKSSYDEARVTTSLSRSQYGPEDFDLPMPYRRIDEWCHARGVRSFNGYEALKGQSGLYFRHDPHLTAQGHEAFARALLGVIRH